MAFASCAKEELNTIDSTSPDLYTVRFGAEIDDSKVVSTSDDENFKSSWINGDEICITSFWNGEEYESKAASWSNDAFEATFDASYYDKDVKYKFKGVYPNPGDEGVVDFGNTRTQNGNNHNAIYDIMISNELESTLPTDNKLILNMNRQTATVYFHLKSALNEKVISATLITENPIAAKTATISHEKFECTTDETSNHISLSINGEIFSTDMQFWFNVLPVETNTLKLVVETEGHSFTMNKKTYTTWEAGHLYTTVIEGIPANKWVEKAGASQKITITKDNSGVEGTYKDSNFTIDGITFDFKQWCVSGSGKGDDIQAKSSQNPSLSNTTAFPGKISKITFNQTSTARSITVCGGTSIKPENNITAPTTAGKMVFDFSGVNYNYFTMNTPGNACYFSSIVIEYESTFDPLNPNYAITVPDAEKANGTVDVVDAFENSIEYAKAGEKLTLKELPNTGYGLTPGTLKAKNSVTGEEIVFETGTTKFTMPAANVIVEAEFYKLPYKVTYDANLPADQELGEGDSVPSDENEYTDENNEVTVKSASLTCLDYNFVGWNTRSDGTGTDYVAGDTFTITENTTLFAKWTDKLYTVTLEAPENGSYVVKNKDGNPLNDNNYQAFSVKNGTELTYTYTADEGYKFKNWQVVDASTHTYTSSLKYTIDRSDITIKGNFEAKVYHKVYFSVEGNITNPEGTSYDEDVTITFPEAPTPSREGFIFIGWTKEAISGTQSFTPTIVDVTKEKVGTADVTYFAVFAEGVVATFDPNDLSLTPLSGDLQWKHTDTGITLKLSAGSHYTSGSPKTFTVNAGTSNYFEISSDNVVSKITATVSGTSYKIGSASPGATLSTVGTTQTVTSLTLNTIKCYATSSQIRLTEVKVESCRNYCTTIPASRQITGITISGDVTKKTYNDGETLDHAGLVVTANYDNGDQQEVTSSTTWSYNPAKLSAVTTSCTVTATYEGKTDSKTIEGLTVNAAAVYTKVTSLDELTVNSQVIIVADGENYAMSTTQNNNNRGQVEITKNGNTISNPSVNVQIFTAKSGTIAKTIAFYTGSGYIYAASNSSNYLKTEDNLSNNSSFALTLGNDGNATLTAQGTNSHNVLRHNSSSSLFSCYENNSGNVNIYKLNGSGSDTKIFADVAVTGVSLNKTETTISVNATETLTATINPDNATNKKVTWTSSVPGVATISDNGIVKGIAEGTATITVKTDDGNYTATCDVTVEAGGQGGGTPHTYTMTIDSSNNGSNNVHWTGSSVTSLTHDNVTWSTSVTGTTSFTSSTTSCQIGSKSNPATEVSLITPAFAGKTITSVKVTCYCSSNTGPTLTVTAGSITMINKAALIKGTSTEMSSTEGTSATLGTTDDLSIVFESSAKAAIYISKIEVKYTD